MNVLQDFEFEKRIFTDAEKLFEMSGMKRCHKIKVLLRQLRRTQNVQKR